MESVQTTRGGFFSQLHACFGKKSIFLMLASMHVLCIIICIAIGSGGHWSHSDLSYDGEELKLDWGLTEAKARGVSISYDTFKKELEARGVKGMEHVISAGIAVTVFLVFTALFSGALFILFFMGYTGKVPKSHWFVPLLVLLHGVFTWLIFIQWCAKGDSNIPASSHLGWCCVVAILQAIFIGLPCFVGGFWFYFKYDARRTGVAQRGEPLPSVVSDTHQDSSSTPFNPTPSKPGLSAEEQQSDGWSWNF